MRNSSSEFQSKQNWVCEKNQSGSKIVSQSLKACTLSASNTEVNDKNRFLWTFWRDFPINFSLELWNHLEFCRKLKNDSCRTQIGRFSNLFGFPLHLYFEYSPANKVYTFFWSRAYLLMDCACVEFLAIFTHQCYAAVTQLNCSLCQNMCNSVYLWRLWHVMQILNKAVAPYGEKMILLCLSNITQM